MEKISIIIPNFNGAELLEKHLPAVVQYSHGSEIIVVDDGSQDSSTTLLHKKFKKVKVIRLRKNTGFANAANTGVKEAENKIVLLLNSDISPRKNYLRPALKYFKDKTTFAVGLEDQSHEGGRIIPRGRGSARFKRGFVEHFAAVVERGITFWTSGGSSLFDRGKFLKLGGFDIIYKPFYWEDIDLGFRAWKSGYKCYFEPLAKVDHYHEQGAIKKNATDFFIRTVSYKNQFLFVWKNVDNYYLAFLHLVWLPFHIVKAIMRSDLPFFYGLMLASLSLPNLIKTLHHNKFTISEQEVFNKFEK